jgi:hypothetical protein
VKEKFEPAKLGPVGPYDADNPTAGPDPTLLATAACNDLEAVASEETAAGMPANGLEVLAEAVGADNNGVKPTISPKQAETAAVQPKRRPLRIAPLRIPRTF